MVYKAVQLSNKRVVAIKMLKPEYQGDREFLRRFEREAQAVLTLSHENIVRSYDVGEEEGCPYIVLEHVQGDTLKNMIKKQGAMPWRDAVHIAMQILDGLAHAHAQGIIHRDVKSQNVLVNSHGKAKLTDFGIARDAQAETMTFSGQNVLGSVHYLSPEQARGGVVDVESDIYSMGITLYEMVTGDLPFKGDNTVAVALKHLHDNMVPPIEVRAEIPQALNDVILKATAKDPAFRYSSAKAMRQDLARALREPKGKFVNLESPAPAENSRNIRKRAVLGIGIGVAIIIVMLVVGFLFATMFIDQTSVQTGMIEVPMLSGKTLAEAQQYAQSRNFVTEVVSWEPSDTVAKDVVIRQEPSAGANAKEGASIKLIVSTGSDMHTVPDLRGLTLAEALDALAREDLIKGAVFYQTSEMEAGLVFQQDPAEGTPLLSGDEVDLYISGEASQNVETPLVTGLDLDEALTSLYSKGLINVWVYDSAQAAEDVADDMVVQQSPVDAEMVAKDTKVMLTINNKKALFVSDIAFNVDSEARGTQIDVTCMRTSEDGIPYEQHLYSTVLSPGSQIPISFRGALDSPGDYEVIIYKDGKELAHRTASFAYRN